MKEMCNQPQESEYCLGETLGEKKEYRRTNYKRARPTIESIQPHQIPFLAYDNIEMATKTTKGDIIKDKGLSDEEKEQQGNDRTVG